KIKLHNQQEANVLNACQASKKKNGIEFAILLMKDYFRRFVMRTNTKDIIKQTEQYGAQNYKPLPVVISEAEGVWVKDPEGNQYMDMLSSYSALNQGHRHPKVMEALREQAERVTLTSRAFHNDQLGPFYEKVSKLTGKDMVLPMNSGAEAVETAIKAARRWGYDKKGIAEDKAEIIACEDNFHGRT